jgi:hypothetical protein
MPSQWALQYFDPSVGMQEQAGFSHFFGCAIAFSSPSAGVAKPSVGHGGYDARDPAKDGNREGSRRPACDHGGIEKRAKTPIPRTFSPCRARVFAGQIELRIKSNRGVR